MKIFNINDEYFKYQKCLSGITYHYVNQLDNIYEKNLMVGNNYCIYCMYNEFDIINNFMVNMNQIDLCSSENLDLNKRYFKIDGEFLRNGHKVLLINQNDPIENDIYIADSLGFLRLSNDLDSSDKNWRYKAYIKLGNNKGKQFHLKNTGNRFPLTGERKYFLDGHGYIIKNIFNYDLFDTSLVIPKILFTDYKLARLSLNKNYELYDGFTIPNLINLQSLNIKYHNKDYIIKIDNNINKYIYSNVISGSTHWSGGTIYNYNDISIGNGYQTYIKLSELFCDNANVDDYIEIMFSGSTNLYLKTFIKNIGDDYIIIDDYIPDHVLGEFYNITSQYAVINLMYSSVSNLYDTVLKSYYSNYISINYDNNLLYPIQNKKNIYFDYDGLNFIFSGNTNVSKIFETNNYYVNYKLYEHLNKMNSYLFNTGYSFLIDYSISLSEFSIEYYDNRPNPYLYPNTNIDSKGTLIKIIPFTPSNVNYFRKNTYINIKTNNGNFKSLLVDLKPNEYFIIETYKNDPNLFDDVISIDTIYNLKEISDILYDVFINDINPNNINYYRFRDNDILKNICNAYAEFISEDIGIINNATAFLMQDDKHKFILKVYDPENLNNGGIIRPPQVLTMSDESHTSTSALLPCEIIDDGGSNIIEYGIYYSTNIQNVNIKVPASVILNNHIGPYNVNVYPLNPDTIYYYRAYAINSDAGIGLGEILSFTTSSPIYTPPFVSTVNSIAKSHSIDMFGDLTDRGYSPILYKGVVYQTGSTTLDIDNDIVSIYLPETGEVGQFNLEITGLTHSTLYTLNTFAVNVCGITYGESVEIYTLYPSPPNVSTDGFNNITYNSVNVLFSLISNDGNIDDPIHGVDEFGIVWTTGFTNDVPNIYSNKQPYTGTYNIGDQKMMTISGLTHSQNYYFRSYALNSLYSGNTTSYGNKIFTLTLPLPVAPTLYISGVTYFDTYNANISNIIVNDGGSPILDIGTYYQTGLTVTTGDTFLDYSGITNWTSNLTGLTANTQYSVMSIATNLFGTGYSNITGFTTRPQVILPDVDINYLTSNPTGTTLEGIIINDGYSNILSKGFLYSGDTLGTSGWFNWYSGTGSNNWINIITGLTPASSYYAQSYATNITGTSYSDIINWTTPSGNIPPVFSPLSPVLYKSQLNDLEILSEIIDDGGDNIISRGLMYSGSTTTGWVDIIDDENKIGEYYTNITGLTYGTKYWVYSYAVNSEGTGTSKISEFSTIDATIPEIIINKIDSITTNQADIYTTITYNGGEPIINKGLYLTGSTNDTWSYITGGSEPYIITLTGLTELTNYTGQSYATNIIGTGLSNKIYFTTLAINNLTINLDITSSSYDPYVYEIGSSNNNIVTNVSINRNNLPLNLLFSGYTTFSAGPPVGYPSSQTGLTWGAEIISANNISNPYTYNPILIESQQFTANEICGYPSEIKSTVKSIQSVYPYLTSNRVNIGGIPSDYNLRTWSSDGRFYTGNFLNNEPMIKKIEIKSKKVYQYNIGLNNALYFAYPVNYGLLSSIKVNNTIVPKTGPGSPYIYYNVIMESSGLLNNWSTLSPLITYYVYIIVIPANLGVVNVTYEH